MQAKFTPKQLKEFTKISKNMAYLLRHGAKSEGLKMDNSGYIAVNDILGHKLFINVTHEDVLNVVITDKKGRYEVLEKDGTQYLRAVQGHSIEDLNHDSIMKPIFNAKDFEDKTIVHGSIMAHWDIIRETGLKAMSRNHMHFAIGYKNDEGVKSGMRNDCDLFIEMDLELVLNQGISVYLSSNNVVLTPGVAKVLSPIFFKAVYKKTKDGNELIFSNNDLKSIKYDHCFRHLFVLDFEANCEQDKRIEPQEIIEFPIVPVDVETQKASLDSIFHSYVTPAETTLTDFCTDLTGITYDMVKDAGPIAEVLKKVDKYVQDLGIKESDFCFVTCGDFDFKCLNREMKHKGIEYPAYLRRYINFKDLFKIYLGEQGSTSMPQMLQYFNLELDGKHHSGIDDSKNIAKVLIEILKKGCLVTKSYAKYI